LPTTHHRCNL